MPINVFGSTSAKADNKMDTSLFIQKPYSRSNCIESNVGQDNDTKDQFRIKNLADVISIRETASKNFVDTLFTDPSKIKNTDHVEFNDKNLDNVRFVKVNSLPAVSQYLSPKQYVDDAIGETSLVGNNQINDFN